MAIFDVLVEPNRRAILDLLLDDDLAVGDLVDALDIAQPTVSKHLKVLRDAGLVTAQVDANRRVYRLRTTPLLEVEDWLTPFRRRWSNRLDALERLLDATVETDPPTREGEST